VERGRAISRGLFLAGLALAFLGQHYFSNRRIYARDGVLLWCLAALCFGALVYRLRKQAGRSVPRQSEASGGKRLWRLVVALGGALLSVLAGLWARSLPPDADFSWLLVVWLTGVACYLAAFVPAENVCALRDSAASLAKRVFTALRERHGLLTAAALGGLLLAALLVRAVDLEHIPANLSGDEGTWGVEGLAMVSDGLANPFATRWFSFPSMSFLAWGIGMRVFGETVAGLRALSALIGAATVLTTFLLADELWGRRAAWLAGVLLACGHYHLHYSRLALNNIGDGLLITLALWLVARAMRTGSPLQFALAGVVVGAGWYAYFGARLIGVIIVAYVVWRAVARRIWRERASSSVGTTIWRKVRPWLVLVGAALVVTAPLMLHYAAHPDDWDARSRQVSIFASGWLAQEQVITGRSAASLLLQQLWKSVSAFNYTLDPTFHYHPSIPLLDTISGVLFLAGVIWAALHLRHLPNALLLLWLGLTLLTGSVITENPPSSARLVIVSPALALLTSLGLIWLVDTAQRLLGGCGLLWKGVTGACLAAIAAINLHYYFVVYTPIRVYGNPTAEVTTVLARQLVQQGSGYVTYFFGPPFAYWEFGTLRFMAQGIPGVSVPPIGESAEEEPLTVDPHRGACFVFLPERLAEMDEIRARYPAGAERRVYSDADGRLLYVVYQVPAPGGDPETQ